MKLSRSKENVPFEGIFGDTVELRVTQFLFCTQGLSFTISEIAEGISVARKLVVPAVNKLYKWRVIIRVDKLRNADLYIFNPYPGYVDAFTMLNNNIIEQILGKEELERIADYAREHECP